MQAKARQNEFYFAPAAFAVQMAPGDLIVIGPDKYTAERQTLGGLFFNKPEGTLFFNPAKRTPPQIKPAVRVYVLICTAINDAPAPQGSLMPGPTRGVAPNQLLVN